MSKPKFSAEKLREVLHYDPDSGVFTWASKIGVAGKQHYLGTFDTPEMAHVAYVEGKRRMHQGGLL